MAKLVRSNVKVDFLQKSLLALQIHYTKCGEAVDFIEKNLDFGSLSGLIKYLFMPSGEYTYRQIKVSNLGKLDSDYWPQLTFVLTINYSKP